MMSTRVLLALAAACAAVGLAAAVVDPGIADPNWKDPNMQTEGFQVRGEGWGRGGAQLREAVPAQQPPARPAVAAAAAPHACVDMPRLHAPPLPACPPQAQLVPIGTNPLGLTAVRSACLPRLQALAAPTRPPMRRAVHPPAASPPRLQAQAQREGADPPNAGATFASQHNAETSRDADNLWTWEFDGCGAAAGAVGTRAHAPPGSSAALRARTAASPPDLCPLPARPPAPLPQLQRGKRGPDHGAQHQGERLRKKEPAPKKPGLTSGCLRFTGPQVARRHDPLPDRLLPRLCPHHQRRREQGKGGPRQQPEGAPTALHPAPSAARRAQRSRLRSPAAPARPPRRLLQTALDELAQGLVDGEGNDLGFVDIMDAVNGTAL